MKKNLQKSIIITTKEFFSRIRNQAVKTKLLYGFCAFAALSYFFYLFTAVLFQRILYADGSFFLTTLLSRDFPLWPYSDDFKHIRLFVNLLNQFWAAAYLKFGFNDLQTFQVLFGAGYYFTAPALYVYCGWLSYRAKNSLPFLFAMISLASCSMPSEIFAINQALTTVALCWVIFHYLVLDLKITKLDIAVITVISIFLFRSHEGMLLWGAVFALVSAGRIFLLYRQGQKQVPTLIFALGLLGILQAAFVGYWQLSHPVEEATQNFLQTFNYATPSRVLGGIGRLSALTLGMLSCVILPFPKRLQQVILFGGSLGILVHALDHFGLSETIFPMDEYGMRVLIPFLSPLMMLAAALAIFLKPFQKISRQRLVVIAAAGILGSSLWQIGSNFQWNNFVQASKEVLDQSSEVLISPLEVYENLTKKNQPQYMNYSWGWTWSVYGLNLQDQPVITKIYRPLEALESFKLPSGEDKTLILPFVHFLPGGYFQFDEFLKACNQIHCTGTLGQ